MEFKGPKNLADILLNRKPQLKLEAQSLEKLIGLAYSVSLMKEEGRYPKFLIFVPHKGLDFTSDMLLKFRTPIKIENESLHRLAACVSKIFETGMILCLNVEYIKHYEQTL